MEQYQAKIISNGIAIGKLCIIQKNQSVIEKHRVNDVEAELIRYKEATNVAIEQLKELAEKALLEMGEEGANIFGGHQLLLTDVGYQQMVCELLQEEKVTAEYAVAHVADEIAGRLEVLENEYIRERAADMKDVSHRLVSILSDKSSKRIVTEKKEPYILFAEELFPADILEINRENLLAIVMQNGSSHSHAAILAKTLGVPAVTKISLNPDFQDKTCIVDGINGILIIEPDEPTLEVYRKRQQEWNEQTDLFQELKGKQTFSKEGKPIKLMANVGDLADVEAAISNDAEGIGLFRSEFLFLGKTKEPTEEEQFEIYKTAIQKMEGKPVIIRTLDLGDDKQVPYFDISEADGRGIRFCLQHKEVFKSQLKAIFRAAVYGELSVLYPMITETSEIEEIRKIVTEVEKELLETKMEYVIPKQGIMIETPQAAVISNELAKRADFISIGTNDLICYTLELNRLTEDASDIKDKNYDEVYELIKQVITNAHKEGITVSICGELAADMEWTETFWEMGVDSLSMVPRQILPLRKKLKELTDTLLL
ncbi:MAG: phosphoenolpyruvate--protein phosphotransferase [Lachnospiraceae bacterium]|nr:phosphoenolpyruvate--protein phosphotransferase [Lachnospiraceae bacterium]